jgi:predicted Fe-S protein YdhL (DUF1289 family)
MNITTESPCIGICSTVYGDDICRGCKRHYLEVINWNRYADPQKQRVNQRLEQQIEKIVADFLIVEDAKKLKIQLDLVILRPSLYANPFYWAYELLRLKAAHITCLQDYGLSPTPPYQTLSAKSLFTQIDDCLYATATTAAQSES